MEGNVPKLIVRDIFRNIPRFYRDIEKKAPPEIQSMDLPCGMRVLYPLDQPSHTNLGNRAILNQQTIFKMNLGIFRHISRNIEVRKNPKQFWKDINT